MIKFVNVVNQIRGQIAEKVYQQPAIIVLLRFGVISCNKLVNKIITEKIV